MHHLLAKHPLRDTCFAEALWRGELRVAVGFIDLVSSTAWAHSVEPAAHSEALRPFEMRAATLVAEHSATLVKLIGDEPV